MRVQPRVRLPIAIAIALFATLIASVGGADPALAMPDTHACSGVGGDTFSGIVAPPDVDSIVVGDDPGDFAGPGADLVTAYDDLGAILSQVSFVDCVTLFISMGVGDELLTVNTLDANTDVTSAILIGHDWDPVNALPIDEIGDDRIVLTSTATPIPTSAFFGSGDDRLEAAPGFAGNIVEARGGFGADVLLGGAGNDVLHGEWDDDVIKGRAGNDVVFGGPGDDIINLGGGADNADGGEGNDIIKAGGGTDGVAGGPGNDTILGQGAADILNGEEGDDVIDGGNGADDIAPGPGQDIARGQTGPDQFFGEEGDDQLFGGNGNDEMSGGPGFDKCSGNLGPADRAQAATCEQTPGVEILF